MRATSRPWIAALLVWALVGGLAVAWWSELRWALSELPFYLDARILSPRERVLYRMAAARLEVEGATPQARALLESSLAIDPYSEAGYWLARWHERAGDPAAALRGYEGYLEIDPDHLDAWLRAIALREAAGEREAALALAERGFAHFAARETGMRPRYDPEVQERFNRKAQQVHAGLRAAKQRLARAKRRLEAVDDRPGEAG